MSRSSSETTSESSENQQVGVRDVVGVTLTVLVVIFTTVLFVSGIKRRARKFAKRTAGTTASFKQL